ncbi:MAG: hypothetical protein AB7G36_10060 [Candidatus Nanopelagicales bacterium]
MNRRDLEGLSDEATGDALVGVLERLAHLRPWRPPVDRFGALDAEIVTCSCGNRVLGHRACGVCRTVPAGAP